MPSINAELRLLNRKDNTFVLKYKHLVLFYDANTSELCPSYSTTKINSISSKYTPKIRKVRVEVTLKCNCKCKYCLVYNNNISQLNQSMTLETANKIIKYIKKNSIESLMLIGGEPFLNWEVVKHFIENTNIKISIYTNALLINSKMIPFLRRKNVKLYISLDGRTEKENALRMLKDGTSTFYTTIKKIKQLKNKGCFVGITCLATNSNLHDLFNSVRFFHKTLGVRVIGISIPHHTIKKISFNIKKYTQEMKRIFVYAKEHGLYITPIANLLNPIINHSTRIIACKAVGEQITFYPDGTSTICTKLDTLKKRNTMKTLVEKLPIYNPLCSDCIAKSLCGGGCPWDSSFYKEELDIRNCYYTKEMTSFILKNIIKDMHKHNLSVDDLKITYKKMITK